MKLKEIKKIVAYKHFKKFYSPNIRKNTNDVKLHYAKTNEDQWRDDKKTLILLHGLFGNKNNLRGITYDEEIKKRRNTIIVDMRNHGFSDHHNSMTYSEMCEDVKRLIDDELKIKSKFTILGHSMGAKVAMTFACKYKDQIDGLFVLDAIPKSHLNNKQIFDNIERVVNKVSSYDLSNNNRKDTLDYFNKELGGSVANLLNTNIISSDDKTLAWRINVKAIKENFDNILGWEDCGSYPGPIRILNGEKSMRFYKEHFDKVFPNFKMRDLRIIQGATHWIHADKPNETIKEIVSFLKEIDNIN